MSAKIIIRPYVESDFDEVVELLVESFQQKFASLSGLSSDELPRFLKEMGVMYKKPFEGFMVVEEKGIVIAVMVLEWKGQVRPEEQIHFFSASREYGFFKVVKSVIGFWLLMSNLQQGECYVEHIAVKPEARGKGIGSKLLQWAQRFAEKKGFSIFSLHVAGSNQAARLYEREGFSVAKRKQSRLMKKFFGIYEWLYMVKKI